MERRTEEKEFVRKYESKPWLYQRFFINPFYKALQALIPKDINSVHELACGDGHSTEKIHAMLGDKQISASDVDLELVDLAQKRNANIPIAIQSIYQLPKDAHYDLVIALEVLEHLENYELALEKLQDFVKGYLILSVPREPLWRILNILRLRYWKTLGNTPGHINHWSRSSFIKLLSKHFDIVEVKNPIPWTMVLVRARSWRSNK